MKKIKTVLWLLNLIILVSCTPDSQKEISIIPEPKSLVQENGEFIITTETKIYYDNKFEKIDNAINYFNSYLLKSNGFELESVSSETSKKNFIYLKQEDSISNKEGYELASTIDGVTISAFNSQGIFNGIQSLLQLLPSEVYSQTKLNFALTVPVVLIKDEPRFNYRGVHLDVGRHFYPKEDIKKYIDYLAMHKINKFHWHLTEDQGWRIEIKEYPKLTEIGAWRNEADSDGKPYGGFYTQEDVKEIVKYASDRFLTIIPEIEMPGHSMA
ncbi:MAG: family 20 glycosylhydrolase, partial [Ignavibacteriae bacterium]|nr:family 20 glycosylhydrolase [Ignavibacteriota bacterium]